MPRQRVQTRRSVRLALTCLAAGWLAGCAGGEHDVARDLALERAEQVAHETGAWATDSSSAKGWKTNQQVLDRLVTASEGEVLTSEVPDPDARGVGLLATVEVVMLAVAPESWGGAAEAHYNVCVRFEVRRESTGPREITAATFDCPRGVPPTRPPR
ncbi:hypothetical protein [Plantactinospora sp. CA-290183]|uniref:hypothetical protein n=1 Tax=Plantactinospora sp. CA-290183 TaxID=3240006 RepID=UPI003D89C27C